MVILFIVVGGIIIKCAGGTCESISVLTFSGLATAGVLELIYEVKGFVSIFKKKD